MFAIILKYSIVRFIVFGVTLIIGLFLFVACTSETPELLPATATISKPSMVPESQTPTNGPAAMVEPTPTLIPSLPTKPVEESLPVEPQRIEFEAEDGTVLVGFFYPPAKSSSPLVIMMHWARGDQSDWVEIAQWLQNRVDEYPEGERPSETTVSSMLPTMPKELSFAVFTFDFRGFGESTQSSTSGGPEGWLMDAIAAVDTAQHLSGVSASTYINIGASIGGDSAIDACNEGCNGALSISPGSYLGVNYSDAVSRLESLNSDAFAWCLASEADADSFEACQAAESVNFVRIIYPGNLHGMDLFQPGLEPDIAKVLQEFILLGFGID